MIPKIEKPDEFVVIYFAQTKKDSRLSTIIRDAMVLAIQGMRHFAVIISRAVIFSAFANVSGQAEARLRRLPETPCWLTFVSF